MIFGFDSAAARRYAELVNRLFGIESGEAPLPPGFLLEVDREEWRFLKRENTWTTGPQNVGAAAGNFSRLQIHNPVLQAGSGRIVVVEGFIVTNPPVVTGYVVTMDGALAPGPANNIGLDSRVPIASGGVRKVASLNRVGNDLPGFSGTQITRGVSQVGIDLIFNFRTGPTRPIVLMPNTVCEIVCGLANTALFAIGFGYERPATPDELAS